MPRLINKLCDLALVYAASVERRTVGIDLIRELLSDGLFVTTQETQDVFQLVNPVNVPLSKAAE